MTDDMSKLAAKAYKQVEKTASDARNKVASAMRDARAERRRAEVEKLSAEAKRLKREKKMGNHQIAEKLGVSESTVRALLIMKEKK